jgi:hypothetical protein
LATDAGEYCAASLMQTLLRRDAKMT